MRIVRTDRSWWYCVRSIHIVSFALGSSVVFAMWPNQKGYSNRQVCHRPFCHIFCCARPPLFCVSRVQSPRATPTLLPRFLSARPWPYLSHTLQDQGHYTYILSQSLLHHLLPCQKSQRLFAIWRDAVRFGIPSPCKCSASPHALALCLVRLLCRSFCCSNMDDAVCQTSSCISLYEVAPRRRDIPSKDAR